MDTPWFPFYPADFLSSRSTALMTTSEIGAYALLLCYQWMEEDCSLPNDPRQLGPLVRLSETFDVVWLKLSPCFPQVVNKPERLRNPRLYIEWKKAKQLREDRSLSGKKGMAARWGKSLNNAVITKHITKHNSSQSQSQSQSESDSENTPNQKKKQKEKKDIHAPSGLARGNGGSVPVWEAYAEAYQKRYTVKPVRNARVNAALSQLVQRIGVEAAPILAAWFLTHNGYHYVQAQHSTSLLLRDAEGLMTQMRRGRKVTHEEAKQAEATDAMREQVTRVAAILKGVQP